MKAQLKLALEDVEKQALGRGKEWNYILDFLLNRLTDSTFLKALNLAKKDLKRHIVCEVCEFIGQHGELLELLGEPVKLVLATADAFAKFGARASSGATSRILRQKTIEVAVFDEAQAYEIDQVTACVCTGSVRTALFAGDKHQSIVTNWPQWTRSPWISQEAGAEPSSTQVNRPCEEMDTDAPTDLGPAFSREGADVIKNPEKRLFTSWLEKPTPSCLILEVSGCKRCGREVTTFIATLFPDICGALHSSPVAPPTTLVHTFYDSPWQALPGSPALINRVMFGRLAVEIERDLAHARSRGVEPQTGTPIVLVIAYLQRHAQSLREFLTAFFEQPAIKEQVAPLSVACIKVVLLDSARGMTADYVHVIRASRRPDSHDQYWGIQAGPNREYISYMRCKDVCNMWLEVQPFGHPGQPAAKFNAKDRVSKGMALANKRNELIINQSLKYEVIWGNDGEWSWYYQLPNDTCTKITDAIQMGFNACNVMSVDPKSVLESALRDPLAASGGVLGNLRPFLQADLQEVRACGIMLGPAPVIIVDPMLENTVAYNLDYALRFAIKIAPAITVDLRTENRHTQLCIPVLSCQGLDELGNKTVEEGDILLRALMHVILQVSNEMNLAPHELFARTHKAESVDILGLRWYSKACRSDREAVGLIDPDRSGPKRTRVYCYLGGGGLTEASTNLAQGVVCKTKSWETAVAVCVAVSLITAAVPGPTVFLEQWACVVDGVGSSDPFEEHEEEEEASLENVAAEDLATKFMEAFKMCLDELWDKIKLPSYEIMNIEAETSEEDARHNLGQLRAFGFV